MTTIGNDFPVRAKAFCLRAENRVSSAQISPAGTLCFDIFSSLPGDSEVITQVDRLSSIETKIAPRSLRIALGASGRSAITCMLVSRVARYDRTLSERRSLSTSHIGSQHPQKERDLAQEASRGALPFHPNAVILAQSG